MRSTIVALLACYCVTAASAEPPLERIAYNNPGLVVDLGVGLWAWPMPMDYDGDGDLDLVVSCPDKPSNGTWFFENPGPVSAKLPVFKPGVKIGRGVRNARVSHVDGKPIVLDKQNQYRDFLSSQYENPQRLIVDTGFLKGIKTRANQWQRVDFNGDGALDVVIGVGKWSEYGWDDAWDSKGVWQNGPLRGHVYVAINTATTDDPKFAKPKQIELKENGPLEVYGWPSPCLEDWDGDGDLDILCGEFLDSFTYFENTGSRTEPVYEAGQKLTHNDKIIAMDLQMIVPSAIDWDADGDFDLIVGDEDGRVALVENTGKLNSGVPQFLPPVYFQQESQFVKFGALATPFGFDWDGDGDEDILCGNTAGYIAFIENLGMHDGQIRWAEPKRLHAGGKEFRVLAGPNGSIQGPCEAKWGYTTLSVADWDHDGLPDIIYNSIWGKVEWLRNTGTRSQPVLAAPQPLEVAWNEPTPKPSWTWWNPVGKELVTQWRTTPFVVDWNDDDLNDLVMLDHEGYLSLFARTRRNGELTLLPGQRIFADESGNDLQLNPKSAGGSGRRKLEVIDWDGDGLKDLLVNSANADFYQNLGEQDGKIRFANRGQIHSRNVAGHTSSPTTVDWNDDGVPDLLVGAEDGYLYFTKNPRTPSK